jgi:endoglucanase
MTLRTAFNTALITTLLALAALAVTTRIAPAQQAPAPVGNPVLPSMSADAQSVPLGGALKSLELWRAYKARFVTEQGRIIDTANGLISHSEGQGYGLLLAVAANDRQAFDRIWGWTRANLLVRGDELFAWRWDPQRRPAVSDMNNASDGDILIAWALAEAAEFWGDQSYRVAARRVAVEVGRKLVLHKTAFGPLLLPAISGFSPEDRGDGPIVNLSYWVFPALPRLALGAPEFDWSGLGQGGLDVLKVAQFGSDRLPTEWVSAKGPAAKPADGFPQNFAYNSIRIPLYLVWAGIGELVHYEPFVTLWWRRERTAMAVIDTGTGQRVQPLGESGYSAIAALTLCAVKSAPLPGDFRTGRVNENYYPTTLHLLAVIVAQSRYPSCFRG